MTGTTPTVIWPRPSFIAIAGSVNRCISLRLGTEILGGQQLDCHIRFSLRLSTEVLAVRSAHQRFVCYEEWKDAIWRSMKQAIECTILALA